MIDTYSQLKKELSVLYPDVTDIELNEMTSNLIDFYTTAVKAVMEEETPELLMKQLLGKSEKKLGL